MFLENKYTKWYFNIINSRSARELDPNEYYEKHHIIPSSLGGSDDEINLIQLTSREHFIVHWLLTKMCKGEQKKKMYFALYSLSWTRDKTNRIVTSYQYEIAKRAKSKGMSGKNNPIHMRDVNGKNNSFFGKKHTKESLEKISSSQKKRLEDEEKRKNHSLKMKGKLSGEKHPFFGKGATTGKNWKVEEQTCPHCGKKGGANNMKRWHFDNCKNI